MDGRQRAVNSTPLTAKEKQRRDEIHLYTRRLYVLLGRITEKSLKKVKEIPNDNEKLKYLKDIVNSLDEVLNEIDPASDGKCPKGTVWDPVTQTCV